MKRIILLLTVLLLAACNSQTPTTSTIVEEFVGHGVGTSVHEDPQVPHYGDKGTGMLLKEGMVIAIEPMLSMHSAELYILDDGMTAFTEDGSNVAQYEHTIAITKDGPIILTGDDSNG